MSSSTKPLVTQKGFCFRCGTLHDDIQEHFAQEHQPIVDKPRAPIRSWKKSLDSVVEAIGEIRQESDRATQIHKLDKEVIEVLYLVRASLNQTKRNTAAKKG